MATDAKHDNADPTEISVYSEDHPHAASHKTARRFLSALFEPRDRITIRPVETWTEGDRKRSRVLYKDIVNSQRKGIDLYWYSLMDLFDVLKAEKANAFFGVCPRRCNSLGGEENEFAWQIPIVRCLWADLDDCTVEEALKRIVDAGLPEPSVVVSSGNGVHVYWILEEPIETGADPRSAFKEWVEVGGKKFPVPYIWEDRGKVYLKCPKTGKPLHANQPKLTEIALNVQDNLQGIAAAIGGDHTYDLSRLMRFPGTLNRKNERNGDEPKPCTLVKCEPDQKYPFESFAEFAQKSPDKQKREKIAKVPLPTVKKLTPGRQDKLAAKILACDASPVGARSEADFSLCCFAVENGIDRQEVWDRCSSVGKFAERGEQYFETTFQNASEHTREKLYLKAEQSAQGSVVASSGQAQSQNQTGGGVLGEEREKSDKIDAPKEARRTCANYFREPVKHPGKGLLKYWRGGFHRWKDGTWQPLESGAMLQAVCTHLAKYFSGVGQNHINNVIAFVKARCFLDGKIPPNTWLDDSDRGPRIAVENGLLDPVSGTLESHSPDWFSSVKLPATFDPDALCNRWMETLFVNLEGDMERIAILQEFAGYILWPELTYQKFLTLVGEGGNGKSVFIAGLQALLGSDNVSNYSLDSLGNNRFAPAGTIGMLANLCADISEVNKLSEGILKKMVTGDMINVDRKNQPLINVKPTAKLVFSANNLPRLTDRSAGNTRRMIIVPFNREVPEDKKIFDMDKPEFWRDELSGILNWALEGLTRLRQQNGFSHSQACRKVAEQYRLDSNPAADFIAERLVPNEDPESYVEKLVVYQAYRRWCEERGRRPLGDAEFGKEVTRAMKLSNDRKRVPGGRKYVYLMVRLLHENVTSQHSESEYDDSDFEDLFSV